MTDDEMAYDGLVNAGYVVWSEFIAHYYSFKYTEKPYPLCERQADFGEPLDEVVIANQAQAKGCFSFGCAVFLAATDATGEYLSLRDEHQDTEIGRVFYGCLGLLHDKLQEDKPWLLTEEFIVELGRRYLMFLTVNSYTM